MIRVPHHADLSFGSSGSFSVSLWANPTRLRAAWTAVLSKSRDAAPWYGVYISKNDNWYFGANVPGLEGSAARAAGWTHIAAVQNGSAHTRTLYIDGSAAATGSATAADGTGNLVMGNVLGVDGEAFEGVIDEVRIYDRALLAGEIATLATAPATGVLNHAAAQRVPGVGPERLYRLTGEEMPAGVKAAPGVYLMYNGQSFGKKVIVR